MGIFSKYGGGGERNVLYVENISHSLCDSEKVDPKYLAKKKPQESEQKDLNHRVHVGPVADSPQYASSSSERLNNRRSSGYVVVIKSNGYQRHKMQQQMYSRC